MKKNRLISILIVLILLVGTLSGCTLAKYTPVKTISISEATITMSVKDTHKLNVTVLPKNAPQTVQYYSSNSTVAEVSSKGVITAKAEGEAIISAVAEGGLYSKVVVFVTKEGSSAEAAKVSKIELSHTDVSLKKGASLQLSERFTPSNASNKEVTWTSNNTAVARVSNNGYVTALTVGTAVIRVTSRENEDIFATCIVTVTDESSSGGGGTTTRPLDKPVVELVRNDSNGKLTLSWNAVANAAGYAIVDTANNLSFVLSETSYEITSNAFLTRLSDGICNLQVKAIGSSIPINKVIYTDSTSNEVFAVAKSLKNTNTLNQKALYFLCDIDDNKTVTINISAPDSSSAITFESDYKTIKEKSITINGPTTSNTINLGLNVLNPGSYNVDSFIVNATNSHINQNIALTAKNISLSVSNATYEVRGNIVLQENSIINVKKGKLLFNNNYTLAANTKISVSKDGTLETTSGKTITIPATSNLDNDGTVTLNSNISSAGTIKSNGTITFKGTMEITGDIYLYGKVIIDNGKLDNSIATNLQTAGAIIESKAGTKITLPHGIGSTLEINASEAAVTSIIVKDNTSASNYRYNNGLYKYNLDGSLNSNPATDLAYYVTNTSLTDNLADKNIIINEGITLTIPNGKILTNNALLVCNGTIAIGNSGKLINEKEIFGNYTLTNAGTVELNNGTPSDNKLDRAISNYNGTYKFTTEGILFGGISIPADTTIETSGTTTKICSVTLASAGTISSSDSTIPLGVTLNLSNADLSIDLERTLDVKGNITFVTGKTIATNLGTVIVYNHCGNVVTNSTLLSKAGTVKAGEDLTCFTGYTYPKDTTIVNTAIVEPEGIATTISNASDANAVLVIPSATLAANNSLTLNMNTRITGTYNANGHFIIGEGNTLDLLGKITHTLIEDSVFKDNFVNNGTINLHNEDSTTYSFLYPFVGNTKFIKSGYILNGIKMPANTTIATTEDNGDYIITVTPPSGIVSVSVEKDAVIPNNSKLVINGGLVINSGKTLTINGDLLFTNSDEYDNKGTIIGNNIVNTSSIYTILTANLEEDIGNVTLKYSSSESLPGDLETLLTTQVSRIEMVTTANNLNVGLLVSHRNKVIVLNNLNPVTIATEKYLRITSDGETYNIWEGETAESVFQE